MRVGQGPEGVVVVEVHPTVEQQVHELTQAGMLEDARPGESVHCPGWAHQQMSGRSGEAASEL